MREKQRNILIVSDTAHDSDRRIVSGALRRLAERTDWSVTTLNYKNKGFLHSVQLLSANKPFDGVIGASQQSFTAELKRTLPDAIFVNATAANRASPTPPPIASSTTKLSQKLPPTLCSNSATPTSCQSAHDHFPANNFIPT